MFLYTIIL